VGCGESGEDFGEGGKTVKKILICILAITFLTIGSTYSFSNEKANPASAVLHQAGADSGSTKLNLAWFSGFFQPVKSKQDNKQRSKEPTAIFLFGAGLVGAAIFTKKRFVK